MTTVHGKVIGPDNIELVRPGVGFVHTPNDEKKENCRTSGEMFKVSIENSSPNIMEQFSFKYCKLIREQNGSNHKNKWNYQWASINETEDLRHKCNRKVLNDLNAV